MTLLPPPGPTSFHQEQWRDKESLPSEPQHQPPLQPQALLCANTEMTANAPQEKKPPCSPPASFHPSLFLAQPGLSQEEVRQNCPHRGGLCNSALIAL